MFSIIILLPEYYAFPLVFLRLIMDRQLRMNENGGGGVGIV
jgi:hypothetical protein